MWAYLLLFIGSMVASFLGSLQAGLVNTAVWQTAIKEGKNQARWLAVGGALPELVYAALAYLPGTWLADFIGFFLPVVKMLMAGLLMVVGVLLIVRNRVQEEKVTEHTNKEDDIVNTTTNTLYKGLIKGFSLGIINLQLLAFWVGIKFSLAAYWPYELILSNEWLGMVSFGAGAMVGALLLLLLIAEGGARIKSEVWIRRVNLLMGGLLVLAAWSIVLSWVWEMISLATSRP